MILAANKKYFFAETFTACPNHDNSQKLCCILATDSRKFVPSKFLSNCSYSMHCTRRDSFYYAIAKQNNKLVYTHLANQLVCKIECWICVFALVSVDVER